MIQLIKIMTIMTVLSMGACAILKQQYQEPYINLNKNNQYDSYQDDEQYPYPEEGIFDQQNSTNLQQTENKNSINLEQQLQNQKKELQIAQQQIFGQLDNDYVQEGDNYEDLNQFQLTKQGQNLLDNQQVYSSSPLASFRKLMVQNGIDVYILPRTDEHKSEWLCATDQRVAFLAGFTGSNGIAVISLTQAIIWTDGRYLNQIASQSPGWQVKQLTKQSQKWYEYIVNNYQPGTKIQVDGRIITALQVRSAQKVLEPAQIILNIVDYNLVDQIWADKPPSTQSQIYVHEQWAGKSISQKVGIVRNNIQDKNADAALFGQLTEIAWILNLRSTQVPYTHVFKSYLVITQNGGTLYLPQNHPSMNNQQIIEHLSIQNINIQPYPPKLPEKVLCQPGQINYQISRQIQKIIAWDGVGLMRGTKTQKQIQGFRKANLMDAIAMTKYWAWLSKQEQIEEYQAAQQLIQILSLNSDYLGQSFPTMISSQQNSAIIHYFPTQKKSSPMVLDSIIFMDSGSQYLYGTTDISRAFHFGQPTDQQKQTYTRVLLGNLDVQRQQWTDDEPVTGGQLDSIARARLKQIDLDFDHGTGHGVGFHLGVHQWPVGITKTNKVQFQENMIVTDEPGYYEENSYGFRIQNQLVVVRNQQGKLTFQNLTLQPYDRNLINVQLLTEEDKQYINNYHERVWDILSPLLQDDSQTLQWLRQATQPII